MKLWTQNPVGFEFLGDEVAALASDFTVRGRSSLSGQWGSQ